MDLSPSTKDINTSFSPEEQAAISRAIKTRRTINVFTEEVPDREILLDAFEHARWAPNHKLTEPWQFVMLGPETQAKFLDGVERFITANKGPEKAEKKMAKLRKVPGWFIVTNQRTPDDPLREREDYAATSVALHNAILYLWGQGIASKWSTMGFSRTDEAYEILQLDKTKVDIVGVILYGYPDMYPRTKRQEASASVVELP